MAVVKVESERIDAVRRYDVLDTPPDQAFDRITALAARACGTPIAIVSIVDTDRIWFKSHHGVSVDQIGRDSGLCASAILQDGPWIVENAQTDPRTIANPLVAGDFGLGFYLGVPLQTHDGYNLGTLCVLDYSPRSTTEREIADLTDLAAIVMDELELRLAAGRTVALEERLRCEAEERASKLQQSLLPSRLPELVGVELAARYLPANREQVGGDFYDVFESGTGFALVIGDVSGHGTDAAVLTSLARHTVRALAKGDWSPADVLQGLNHAALTTQADDTRHITVAVLRCESTADGFSATVALGGHPHPLLVRSDGSVETIGIPGPLIGYFPDASFTETTLDVGAGDSLFLYTDGLVEAGGAKTRFDHSQLMAAVSRADNSSPDALASGVLAVAQAAEPQPRDDIAFLIARAG